MMLLNRFALVRPYSSMQEHSEHLRTETSRNHVNRTVYNFIFYLALPLILLRLLWRAIKAPAYAKRWSERFGLVGKARKEHQQKRWIWIHAVSVGEAIAAAALIRRLRQQQPDYGIVVTTMTPTGSERVREMFGKDVCHVYAPYDYPGAVKRFLAAFRPELTILMETELWPNIVHYSKRSGAGVLVVNARLSEKSFRGYQKFSKLGRPMLQQIDCIAAQSSRDAERFKKLGVDERNLQITGSVKFEVELPQNISAKKAELSALIDGTRPVWIAASTRAADGINEEDRVLTAFKVCLRTVPDLLLILVPRHPERFRLAEKLCIEKSLTVVRRSSAEPVNVLTNVFLGDSMGEMLAYYGISDVAFVGGSLVDTGCQNVLEPAALGLPVLVGPSQFNFQTICEQLEDAGALKTVRDEQELARAVSDLLLDKALYARMSTAGPQIIEENRGALERTFQLVQSHLARHDHT